MEDLTKIKTLYVMTNTDCNLKCNHCSIRKYNIEYNRNKVLEVINNISNNCYCIITGGESTLHKDRIVELIKTNKISSVTTNLIQYDQHLFDLIYDHNISISTSWNLNRFSSKQYITWLYNLSQLTSKFDITVLITLTHDLVGLDPSLFVSTTIKDLIKVGIQSILFEQMIPAFDNDKVDDWLCKLHNIWPKNIENVLETKLSNRCFNCDNTFTLLPNGELLQYCTNAIHQQITHILHQCLICQHSNHCKPCKLQPSCDYPKKLYQMIYAKISL